MQLCLLAARHRGGLNQVTYEDDDDDEENEKVENDHVMSR